MAKNAKAGQSSSAPHRTPAPRRPSRTWVWVVVGVIAVAALAALAVRSVQDSADIQGVQFFSGLTAGHTAETVTYAQVPPVGGDHSDIAQNCGIYDKPVPNENAVHSLEHGAVWITYQPDLPQAVVDTLRGLVRGHSHLLLSPFPASPRRWSLQGGASSFSSPAPMTPACRASSSNMSKVRKRRSGGPNARVPAGPSVERPGSKQARPRVAGQRDSPSSRNSVRGRGFARIHTVCLRLCGAVFLSGSGEL